MRRLAVLWPRGVHDVDDVGVCQVVEGTPDVPRVESAWCGVSADDVHASDRGTEALYGKLWIDPMLTVLLDGMGRFMPLFFEF